MPQPSECIGFVDTAIKSILLGGAFNGVAGALHVFADALHRVAGCEQAHGGDKQQE